MMRGSKPKPDPQQPYCLSYSLTCHQQRLVQIDDLLSGAFRSLPSMAPWQASSSRWLCICLTIIWAHCRDEGFGIVSLSQDGRLSGALLGGLGQRHDAVSAMPV